MSTLRPDAQSRPHASNSYAKTYFRCKMWLIRLGHYPTIFPAIDLFHFAGDPVFSVYDARLNKSGVAEIDSCA